MIGVAIALDVTTESEVLIVGAINEGEPTTEGEGGSGDRNCVGGVFTAGKGFSTKPGEGTGLCGSVDFARANLDEKNDPIPAPHADTDGAVGVVVFVTVVETLLACSCPARGGETGAGDVSDDSSENGLKVAADFGLSTPSPAPWVLWPSRSDLETSTGVLNPDASDTPEVDAEDEVLICLCVHLPRTPSTALKKFVDPVANVRATASRAGASCCSILSSWIPSCKRRPMSATTEGFSVHGCLHILSKICSLN